MRWATRKIDEIGTISRGRSRHRPRDAAHLYGGPYPFIQTGDVKHAGLYLTEFTQTYSEAGLEQSRLWPEGTLCITIAANIADTSILTFPACFPDSVIGFIPDPHLADVRFVKYLFDSSVQRRLRQFTQGAAQDNLSQEKLLSLELQIPDLPTQRRIAEILSAYDDLIENNQRRMKLLEESARLLYEEWFVRLRFPGHEHTKIIDGIPEGWSQKSFSELAIFTNGYPFKPEELGDVGLPVVKIPELRDGVLPKTPRNPGEGIPEKYFLKSGDLLFSWSGTLMINFWREGDAILNQHLFRVDPTREASREYLLLALRDSLPEFTNQTTGATLKHIRKSALDAVSAWLPAQTICREFDDRAQPIYGQIQYLNSQCQKLRTARDLLLPRLMNGEIEV